MQKLFYTKEDVSEITGYASSKSSEIIRQINIQRKRKFENENKNLPIEEQYEWIETKGRVPVDDFYKYMKLERRN